MSSSPSFFKTPEKSNKQYLSDLYFKSVAEKEVIRRELEKDPYSHNDKLLGEYTAIDNLVDNLRDILGCTVVSVP
jgi:hypothetical protein